MAANSFTRRVLKKVLFPLFGTKLYVLIQAVSKASDIRRGIWTEPELDLIPLAVLPGETALDLGANFGLYSYHIGHAVGDQGHIFAFEPVPFTYDTLSVVTKLLRLHNVTIINKACGNTSGQVSLNVPIQASGAISAGPAHLSTRNDDRIGKDSQVRWDQVRTVDAKIVRLDETLPAINALSLIKADIEGYEYFAFQGAEGILDRHLPTIICEINPWYLEGFNVNITDFFDLLFKKGYQLFSYSSDRQLLPINPDQVVEDNYLFIHPSRLSRFSSIWPERHDEKK